jgi:hypothetical protein
VAKESPAPPPAPSASLATASDVSFDVVNDNWQNILAQLRQTNKMVEALMRSVSLVGVEGNSVIVEAPSDLLKGRIEQPSSKSYVEQSIDQVIGVSANLRCVLKGEYRARPQPPVGTRDTSEVSETHQAEPGSSSAGETESTGDVESEEDPMLQEALSLGAEIKNVD